MTIDELHRKAMNAKEEAWFAERAGERRRAAYLLRTAFERQRSAADGAVEAGWSEPARSIHLRIAAILAIHCGEHVEARRFIELAREGKPPSNVAAELRELEAQLKPPKQKGVADAPGTGIQGDVA